MTLTREQAIDKLIEHDMQVIKTETKNWEERSEFLYKILRKGIEGYEAKSAFELHLAILIKFQQEIEVV